MVKALLPYLRKNVIFWRRNYIASLFELLIGAAIVLILMASKGGVSVTENPYEEYPLRSVPLQGFIGKPDFNQLLLVKNCSNPKTGGRVVLAPPNPVTI